MANLSDNQEKIIDAFFTLAAANPDTTITVQMLADEVGLHRSTFYRYYFASVDDVLDHIHALIDQDILSGFDESLEEDITSNQPLYDFLDNTVLPTLYNRRAWLKVLYKTDLDPTFGHYLLDTYTPIVERYLDKIGKQSPIGNHFAARVVMGEFLALVSTWLTDDEPEPVELFKEKFIAVLSVAPLDFLSVDDNK